MSVREGDAESKAATISGGVFVNFGITLGTRSSSYFSRVLTRAPSIFPERRDVPAARELGPQREHRGVRRDHDELVALGRRADRAGDRAPPRVHDLDALARHAGVLEAVREVTRADAGDDRVLDVRCE